MADWTSLFARKLRAHRAGRGGHGRMTQEELAWALDVSVDAISKYERSLSYIRGDLEHRLVENLGWSREDVIACREDWELGRPRTSAPSYRMLRDTEILDAFGGSVEALNKAVAAMETGDPGDLPDGFSARDTIWREITQEGALTGVYVMRGSDLVEHVGLIFPGRHLETQFQECRFDEGELTPQMLKRTILPGDYFAYCPAVYVARGHEAAARLLLSGFVSVLEELAEREVFIREIGAISVNALGRQLCEDLGLRFHGGHRRYATYDLWVFPGEDFASSLFGRRSPKLRQAYLSRDRFE
ncbi:helix-turn-helix transcriptional regulator [Aestuariicoccus sp. MJ-SS9]|uniref:helix-turn-helix domain-containing protein n=1 Tax=Aestuariicoccus sp. MJ-SS9 TaxID=3079855 RepID=UPI00290B0F23|nr:helix-turn-helix transcriptional regulator [Aestuariicoccus sp. MJ-SS9]MDU8912337.1 helix-turn-helix transcriptional regulator [Aestuariicoccus sp. MJ-SS9]